MNCYSTSMLANQIESWLRSTNCDGYFFCFLFLYFDVQLLFCFYVGEIQFNQVEFILKFKGEDTVDLELNTPRKHISMEGIPVLSNYGYIPRGSDHISTLTHMLYWTARKYNACIYVYMYICMYVCMYVNYVCMYVCMHACMHVCMHACMYVCMYVCIMHACMCVYVCMYVCMHGQAPDWLWGP